MAFIAILAVLASASSHPDKSVVSSDTDRPIDKDLIAAVEAHNLMKVKRLLAAGANANANEKNGQPPLLSINAKDKNAIPIARALLKAGAKVNYRNPPQQMMTPLTAPQMASTSYVKFLLHHGADPNLRGLYGETPLEMAVDHNDLDSVSMLLKAGASLSKRSLGLLSEFNGYIGEAWQILYVHSGETPVFGLARSWSDPMYRLLKKSGADFKAKKDDAWTLLDACVYFGDLKGERFLLEHGASPNAVSNDGFSALHLAVLSGTNPSPPLVQLLMKHGADPKIATPQGKTPTDLLQKRVNDVLGRTPLGKLDKASQEYLDLANQVLKAIDPKAALISNPKIHVSQWKPMDLYHMKLRYRIFRESTRTRLVIHADPWPIPRNFQLSNVYMDAYESTLPGPFIYKLPAGKTFEASIDFSPAAGQAGAILASEFESYGAGRLAGQTTRPLEPSFGKTMTFTGPVDMSKLDSIAPQFTNSSPDRAMEIQIESVGGGYAGSIPKPFRLAPHTSKAMPSLIHSSSIKYSSRLLPNQRWKPLDSRFFDHEGF